jgi:hypothetical protein
MIFGSTQFLIKQWTDVCVEQMALLANLSTIFNIATGWTLLKTKCVGAIVVFDRSQTMSKNQSCYSLVRKRRYTLGDGILWCAVSTLDPDTLFENFVRKGPIVF